LTVDIRSAAGSIIRPESGLVHPAKPLVRGEIFARGATR
jgi:hypothetical protein